LYAEALESIARLEMGELEAAAALAKDALDGVETMQGSEFGTAIRVAVYDTLARAGSPHARYAHERALAHVRTISGAIRDARLKSLFLGHPGVVRVLAAPLESARSR